MELHIVINGRKDLAAQLYQQLREAIATGRLAAGAQLPPSRLLAEQLGVSRKTVSDTYATLTYEGLLVGKIGRGTFVNAWAPQTNRVQTATDLACAANLAKWQALPSPMHHPTRDSTLRYEFIGGATSRHQFPLDEWRRCTQDACGALPRTVASTANPKACRRCAAQSPGTSRSPVASTAATATSWSPTARNRRWT